MATALRVSFCFIFDAHLCISCSTKDLGSRGVSVYYLFADRTCLCVIINSMAEVSSYVSTVRHRLSYL